MSSVGDSGAWADVLDEGLVPRILEVILEAWTTFSQTSELTSESWEVQLTQDFLPVLKRGKDRAKLPVRIDREVPLDDAEGNELGRLDLKFIPMTPHDDVYLTFECKRLHVLSGGWRSLANEYVTEGMMRFVTSQYAGTHRHGGMLGYVLDGDSSGAMRSVDEKIRQHRSSLRQLPPEGLNASSLLPTDQAVRETQHRCPQGQFRLHHVFLPFHPRRPGRSGPARSRKQGKAQDGAPATRRGSRTAAVQRKARS
jgi:hypothetical protein